MDGAVVGVAPLATTPLLLHEVFSRAAARHGARAALEIPAADGRPRAVATYAELDERSNAIARRIASSVGADQLVALLIDRDSLDLFAAQLAVSKAGAAFVSIDPSLPDEYARFLIEDSGAALVLTNARRRAQAHALGVAPSRVVDLAETVEGSTNADPSRPAAPNHLAYAIYTSGTTGKPKGVLVEHRSIVNLIASDLEAFGLGPHDRVAQGSSASYDSSIEETWLAWACGAALVVLDDATVRSGPDLVEWLRRERITVFCPPPTLLRATGCTDPERELPGLRLLYVGGEALPEDVAQTWGRGRRLENGYGPTECTVTATRGTVVAGRAITIGRAISGNRAWVLDEQLREVADGDVGELVIGGAGVARGYHRRPEWTAERFPTLPGFGRVYRTGDLVRCDERGEFVYLGRRDTQVKVRGHRIELEAIEAKLAESPGVRAAACTVQGEGSGRVVVAFVAPTDSAQPPDLEEIRGRLADALPPPMVPTRIALLDPLPTSVGGKLDRKRLPQLDLATRIGVRTAPTSELESLLSAEFARALGLREPVSVEDDFFLELGGDSLRAAELISRLRQHASTAAATVRDLYAARNVRALAANLERKRNDAAAHAPRASQRPERLKGGRPALFTLAQALWIALELLVTSSVLQFIVFRLAPWSLEALGLVGTLLATPVAAWLAALAWTPCSVALTALAKRLLIGRYRPLRAPAFGGFHLRHWIVVRLARRIPWEVLGRTVFAGAALRVLGAKVGRRAHFHRGVDLSSGGWDLLEVGDDATVSQDAALQLVQLEDGALIVGPIAIGAGARLAIRAGMAPGSELGERAELEPLAWLPTGARVPAGERWGGAPAMRRGFVATAGAAPRSRLSPLAHGLVLLTSRGAARIALQLPFALGFLLLFAWSGFSGRELAAWLVAPRLDVELILGGLAVLVACVPLELLLTAAIVRALSPRTPAVISRWSWAYARVWIVTDLAALAGEWLSGTVFYPPWLRLTGMRIGRNCEISTLIDLVPSLVTIGDEVFLADGIYLGGPEVRSDAVRLERTELGRDTFLGNHVVVPIGARLPGDILVGVCTVADASRIEPGSAWFGDPPFELARAREPQFDRSVTHDPSFARRVTRWFWEALRFTLPIPLALLVLAWLLLADALTPHELGELAPLSVAAATVLCGLAAWLSVLAAKWLLLGRVKPGVHPLWSCWCSRWDFLYVAWGRIAHPVLSELQGTLLLNACIRAFGVRIGRRVILGGGFAQVVDPDMLEFEDDATVVGSFQAHTFEDRVLKIGRVRIRREASVGANSVLFYGADIGERARVAPHAVVLKGERLGADGDFAGVPTHAV